MKRRVQLLVRSLHRAALRRELPSRLGVYFHAVEPPDHDAFCECLTYWKDHGYRFVGGLELCRDGGGKRVFLSFDDNFRSWIDLLPILDELGATATFFVNTSPFRDRAPRQRIEAFFDRIAHRGERETLSTSELSEIARAGHTVGCHGHSHRALRGLRVGELHEEIVRSASQLRDLLGHPVEHFSYPFGMRRYFSEGLRRYCVRQGFRTVSNGIPGMQHARLRPDSIQRTPWHLGGSVDYNLDNLRIDGRLFARVTGRSAVV